MEENRAKIQDCLDYMEENLKAEFKPEELAQRSGFSVSHFHHVFREEAGLPLAQYIRNRRLAHIAWKIALGGRAAALSEEYGFETYAGFYKAFLKEFGCSPSEYKKLHRPEKPYRILAGREYRLLSGDDAVKLLSLWEPGKGLELSACYYESTGLRSEYAELAKTNREILKWMYENRC